MPIYEYSCKKCSAEFEQRRSIADMDKRSKCPKCSSRAIARKVSMSFAVVGGDVGGGDFDLGAMGGMDDMDMGGMGGMDMGGMGDF
jgi:putative FmdB family regulatory protein